MYLRDGSAQTFFTCYHTEIEVADQTFYLTQSQYTDTGPTSPSADPITPGAWQGSHWYDSTPKKSRRKRDSNPGSSALEADALTTRPTRRFDLLGCLFVCLLNFCFVVCLSVVVLFRFSLLLLLLAIICRFTMMCVKVSPSAHKERSE